MNYEVLRQISLFDGIDSKDLKSLIACLGAMSRSYEKGEAVLLAGSPIDRVGVVLSGSVQVVKEDIVGNRTIIANIEQNELFAEVFACSPASILPISVIALEDCTVMWIQFRKIITTCSSSCVFHTKLIANMMRLMAEKNLKLNQKIDYLSKRSIRDKLIAYLLAQADQQKSLIFSIPFSRNELADFLCADRSALSRELSHMKEDGLIDYYKEQFKILSKDNFILK